MKKIYLLTALATLACIDASAEAVSRADAQKTAEAFLSARGRQVAQTSGRASGTEAQVQPYYVFNATDSKGFVIVSGDDTTVPVLGYTDSGIFDEANLPSNLKDWLKGCEMQIEALRKSPSKERTTWGTETHETIPHLLTTTWNQDGPYNNLCPEFFTNGKCVTGCVATALAQVLYYHRAESVNSVQETIPGYKCSTNWSGFGQVSVEEVPAGSVIDWNNMLDSYTSGSYTEAQATAVAQLMKYVGAAVKMNYANAANGGSGASDFDTEEALVKYFDYRGDICLAQRHDYCLDDWYGKIYDELSYGRPVYFRGSTSANSGHAFVVDGFDESSNLFHINWGWGGYCDGHYVLSFCNPGSGAGIGAGNVADGYRLSQMALINACPAKAGEEFGVPQVLSCSYKADSDVFRFTFVNTNGMTGSFDGGVAVLDQDGSIMSVETLFSNVSIQSTWQLADLPYTIKEGQEQRLVPVSRASGSEEWHRCWSESKYLMVRNTDAGITVNEMPQMLASAGLELGKIRRCGFPLPVRVYGSNESDCLYDGSVYLRMYYDGQAVGDAIEVPMTLGVGVRDELCYEGYPQLAGYGKVTVELSDADGAVLASQQIDVEDVAPGMSTEPQPMEMTGIEIDADMFDMTEDTDGLGVVIPYPYTSIAGTANFVANQQLSTGASVDLYMYNNTTGSYELKQKGSRWTFNSGQGSGLSLPFNFSNVAEGRYKLVYKFGELSNYDIPSPIATCDFYRFNTGDPSTLIEVPAVAEETAGDNVIYSIDGRVIRRCASADEVQSALSELQPGLYIANGRKVVVK